MCFLGELEIPKIRIKNAFLCLKLSNNHNGTLHFDWLKVWNACVLLKALLHMNFLNDVTATRFLVSFFTAGS